MLTWLKILCAVDLSSGSRCAVDDAAELARRFDAALTLVHVRQPPSSTSLWSELPPERLETDAQELRHALDGWRAEAERIAGRPVRVVLTRGSPAAEIVRLAAAEKPDLVVTGTHGRRGLGRLVLGSVAERVAREAPCPVLVARAPPAARA